MDAYHLTLASDGRMPLFANERARRRAVRVLARVAGAELVLFYIVDDHLHAVLSASRERAGRLAQALSLALAPIVAPPLDAARVRPVTNRAHLRSLVRYILSQGAHHGLEHHPALWTGSCFQDLVGARWLPELTLTIRSLLPRFRLREALEIVGLPLEPIAPMPVPRLPKVGISRIVAATTAATLTPPDLPGRPRHIVDARAAIAQLAATSGFTTAHVAAALNVHADTVRNLRRRVIPAGLTRAVRVRLALEEQARLSIVSRSDSRSTAR